MKKRKSIKRHGVLITLVMTLALVCVLVATVTITVLYQTAFEEKRQDLQSIVETQARLIESIAQFDAEFRVEEHLGGARGATLDQIRNANKNSDNDKFYDTLVFGERVGEMISFVAVRHHASDNYLVPVSFDSDLAEPMRRALNGQSGTMVGLDYNGSTVLAAYEPVSSLNIGIVAKHDLSKVRAPYINAALISAVLSFAIVVVGSFVLVNVSNPVLKLMQETQDRFHLAVENANDAIVAVSEDGFINFWNRAAQNIFGYTEEEIIGKPVCTLIPDYLEGGHASGFSRSNSDDGSVNTGNIRETLAFNKNGNTFPIELSVSEWKSDESMKIMTIIRDITERKTAQASLLVSQQRFKDMVDNMANWVWETDSHGHFSYVSASVKDVLGYEADEMLAISPYELMQPEERARTENEMMEFRAKQQKYSAYELTIPHKNGHLVVLEVSGVPFFNEDGDYIGYRGVCRDVTETQAIRNQLLHSQRMEAVGQLTSGVAHDFNNLLQIIQTNLDIISSGRLDAETNEELLAGALDAGTRGSNLTKQLLAFSRQKAQKAELVNPNELILKVVKILSRTLETSIELECHLDENCNTINVNVSSFETAIINLALNARDAMSGHGTIIFMTENRQAIPGETEDDVNKNVVVVSLRDNGKGMKKDELGRCFDPFFTTKELGQGTGLGLSMVYGFCKQSGGIAKIDSESGKGTIIRMILPGFDVLPAVNSKPKQTIRVNNLLMAGKKALLVEDDDDVRLSTSLLLENMGVELEEATSADAALDILKDNSSFDFIVSDVFMPGSISGIGLADQCASLYKSIKVLLVSGHPDEALAKIDSPSQYYILRKPFSLDELKDALDRVMGG